MAKLRADEPDAELAAAAFAKRRRLRLSRRPTIRAERRRDLGSMARGSAWMARKALADDGDGMTHAARAFPGMTLAVLILAGFAFMSMAPSWTAWVAAIAIFP